MTRTACDQCVTRIQQWLAETEESNLRIAKRADVHEKTVRDAAAADWNPRISTLAKMAAAIPRDWQPQRAKRRTA